jgi:hypothetical protein
MSAALPCTAAALVELLLLLLLLLGCWLCCFSLALGTCSADRHAEIAAEAVSALQLLLPQAPREAVKRATVRQAATNQPAVKAAVELESSPAC